jgi:NADPH2:quinone reductase
MKALLSKTCGGPDTLVLEEMANPAAEAGEVVIAIKACGVNFPDVLVIEDKYQARPPRPFSPGGEIAGVIEIVGEGVEGFKPGDRVLAITGWGGMAEKAGVAAARCLPLPDGMPFDEGAAFITTYGTSYHALKDRAGLQPGQTLLVLGAAGGVGLAAVELGKAMGARVIAAASTQEKVDAARERGADEGMVYPANPSDAKALSAQFKEACGKGGAHVVFDAVGGLYAEAALRALAWKGHHLVIGFAAGIPVHPAQPDIAEGGLHRRRVLGLLRGKGAGGARAQHGGTHAPLRRGEDPTAHLGALPAGRGRESHQGPGRAQGRRQGCGGDRLTGASCRQG